jgi:hypothetical protein
VDIQSAHTGTSISVIFPLRRESVKELQLDGLMMG